MKHPYALIGSPLGHSFSPRIHRTLGLDYELKELSPQELPAFLHARDFRGLNVTVPYKRAVLPYLDELTPAARRTGAVNTILNENGRLIGDNTDLGGMACALRRLGIELRGKAVLILGTGGTAHTAKALLEDGGAARTAFVSRTGKDGALSYADAPGWGADLLVNATPCGMAPHAAETPLGLDGFDRLEAVFDVIYHPLRTRLVLAALDRDLPALGGLYMLAAQGVLAAERFTGTAFPADTTERIYRLLLRETRNVVLIGMPGAGKSALGRALAARLGRPFADADEEVTRRTGRTPADWIRTAGEAAFRTVEAEVLADLSAPRGRVLATGGGAVLRQENVLRLRQNGLVVWLRRPLAALEARPDRPLSDTPEKLRSLYADRAPLYRAAADETVSNAGTEEETLRALEALL